MFRDNDQSDYFNHIVRSMKTGYRNTQHRTNNDRTNAHRIRDKANRGAFKKGIRGALRRWFRDNDQSDYFNHIVRSMKTGYRNTQHRTNNDRTNAHRIRDKANRGAFKKGIRGALRSWFRDNDQSD